MTPVVSVSVAVVAALVLASAQAAPLAVPYSGLDLGALYSQYHAQDELGQYSFGYSGPSSTKHEQKTADGVTRGTYSYVDPHGQLQTRSYTADDVNGFRVAASDLPVAPAQGAAHAVAQLPATSYLGQSYQTPSWQSRWDQGVVQDTPEVAAAKAQHLAAVEQVKLRNAAAGSNNYRSGNLGAYTSPSAGYPAERRYLSVPLTPYTYQSASPMLAQTVALPSGISSQYHAQDEAGQYTFGYANDIASKSETKTLDGVTRGSYSYLDPNGQVQSRSYVADQGGFRVVASDLPQVNI